MRTHIPTTQPFNVFWFRRDLRFEDNHGLFQALSQGIPVLPLFIFDRQILDKLLDRKDARITFLHQELRRMNRVLQNRGSRLWVHYGEISDIWKNLSKMEGIQGVFTNQDYEPYAIQRDQEVKRILTAKNIKFNTFKDQVIFEKDDILNSQNQPYKVFTPYSRKWRESLHEMDMLPFQSKELSNQFVQCPPSEIIALGELGFEKANQIFPTQIIDKKTIENYDTTRNFPGIEGTSRFGIHLRFGTISIRNCVRFALRHNTSWLNQLIWREFFMMILHHFPYVVHEPFRSKYKDMQWANNGHDFQTWCEGKTGYPLVDAGMRELNQTGFMHNRVRMVTASFLVKHLQVNWQWGERYFAEKLLDYDLSANNGNWQWAAGCGCDAVPFFRIFNPITQQKKFDPQFQYIKKWVPEFGQSNYPNPMVDHRWAREEALRMFRSLPNQT